VTRRRQRAPREASRRRRSTSSARRRVLTKRRSILVALAIAGLVLSVGALLYTQSHHVAAPVTIQGSELHQVRRVLVLQRDGGALLPMGEAGLLPLLPMDEAGVLSFWVVAQEMNINTPETSSPRTGVGFELPEPAAPVILWLPLDLSCQEVAETLRGDCDQETLMLPEGIRLSSGDAIGLNLEEDYPIAGVDVYPLRFRGDDAAVVYPLGWLPVEACLTVERAHRIVLQSNNRTIRVAARPMNDCGGLRVLAGDGPPERLIGVRLQGHLGVPSGCERRRSQPRQPCGEPYSWS
jgi:hypothetical protein